MTVKKTDKGVLFGKTGSGTDERGACVLGWFVSYVESKGKTYMSVFRGADFMGLAEGRF